MPTTILTPVALVAVRRGRVAPQDAHGRYQEALLLMEAGLKWTAVYAASLLAQTDAKASHAIQYELARAEGLGVWVQSLERLASRLVRAPQGQGRELALALTKRRVRGDAAAASLWSTRDLLAQAISALDMPDYEEHGRVKKNVLDLLNDAVFLRNRTRGHGAPPPKFYDIAAPALEGAVDSLLPSIFSGVQVVSFVGQSDPTGAHFLVHAGATPSTQVTVAGPPATTDRDSLSFLLPGTTLVPVCRLARFESRRARYLIANGVWRESSLTGQYIDYASGDVADSHVPAYGGPRPTLPLSHTTAGELQVSDQCLHNLPARAEHYVERAQLQRDLRELLTDRVHRILTLKGPGGTGKTSLALRVLWELLNSDDCGFEYIAWLSARDVDLLVEGPAARHRDVSTLDSVAAQFTRTFDLCADPQLARTAFVDHMENPAARGPTLLVIDNFETLDDPEGIHRFLDSHVLLPSKLLITSRHKTYRGDFPVEVRGMEPAEARELLGIEARHHHCEPRLNAAAMERIIEATSARPYAMKLAVANFARGGAQLTQILDRTLGRGDVLDALFERSYGALGDDGEYLYLLLGTLGRPCPEVIAHGLLHAKGRDPFAAVEEVQGMSLVEYSEAAGAAATLVLPAAAQAHARGKLIGHADEIEIRSQATEVKSLLDSRESVDVVSRFLQRLVSRVAADLQSGRDASASLRLIDRCASGSGQHLLLVANGLEQYLPADAVRAYYKHAVETSPSDATIWRDWSYFERRRGDREQEAVKAIRAVELGFDDPVFCTQIAGLLLDVFRHDENVRSRFPAHRREALSGSLRERMEVMRRRGRLDSSGLARLGWLYFSSYSPASNPRRELVEEALACAREGLEANPECQHCAKLEERAHTTLG